MTREVGQPAPPFTLRDRDRQKVTLESYPDKHLVVAFYPLAFTGGCESEMTAFRTHTDAFTRANAQVLGVSVDSFASAGKFQEELGLEFPLLSDFPKNRAGREYGVYNEDFGVADRVTFVIDKDRVIRAVHAESGDFESHPIAALEALKELGENPD